MSRRALTTDSNVVDFAGHATVADKCKREAVNQSTCFGAFTAEEDRPELVVDAVIWLQ